MFAVRNHRPVVVLLLTLVAGGTAARAQDPENCLFCHQYPGLSRLEDEGRRIRVFYVDPAYVHSARGPHAKLRCTDCHPRDEVGVVPHAAVTPVDCTRTCHIADPAAPARTFSHAGVAQMLEQSAHRAEVLGALRFSGGPLLKPGQSQCLYCHDEPVFRNPLTGAETHPATDDRGLDRCDVCHTAALPVDTRYMLRHTTARLNPPRTSLELAQVCAVCHSDPQIRADHDLTNSIVGYVRSFHGKAALLGDQTTAGCVDCHVAHGANAHLMLGPDHPASAVAAGNVANSCRSTACHPGADPNISHAAVHLDLPSARQTPEFLLALLFIVLTVFTFGPSMVLVLLELAQIALGRHYHYSASAHLLALEMMESPAGRRQLERFSPGQRWQHWGLAVLFTLLVLTGFPMKFADQGWARVLVGMFGGLATARQVHHLAGIALFFGVLAHLVTIAASTLRRALLRTPSGQRVGLFGAYLQLRLAPTPADLKKGLHLLAYLLGLRRDRPTWGRFTIAEKFEYFGVIWGTLLLGLTGMMLWGEQLFSQWMSGRVFNFALIIHTYESFLALIHVGILHIATVMFSPLVFPLNLATLSGRTPIDKLAEEHGEFVAEAARQVGLRSEGVEI